MERRSSGSVFSLVVVVLLLFSVVVPLPTAQGAVLWLCDLRYEKEVHLRKNGTEHSLDRNFISHRRGLAVVEDSFLKEQAPAIQRSLHNDPTATNAKTDSFPVRLCDCADSTRYGEPYKEFYCVSPMTTHCALPSSWSTSKKPPMCVVLSDRQESMRYVWLLCLVLYGMIASCLVCTSNGRSIFHGAISVCFRGWNRRLILYIQEKDPRRANTMLRSYWRRRRQRLEREYRQLMAQRAATTTRTTTQEPAEEIEETLEQYQSRSSSSPQVRQRRQLALKTRIFRVEQQISKKQHQDFVDNQILEDEEELTCTICFVPLQDGDRIGALPCDHIFHVDCLKTWLSRRNACPLCAITAAKEQMIDEPEAAVTTTEPDSDGNRQQSSTNSVSDNSEAV